MRRYTFVKPDGSSREWDAEMDTLKEGTVILSKQKEFKGAVARTDVKPEIVVVYSLANFEFYTYVEKT